MTAHCSAWRRWRAGRQSGQSLVEFALILPIMLVLLFGVIDVSMLLTTKNSVAYASRQGARLLAAYGPTSPISTTADPDPLILNSITDTLTGSGLSLNGLQKITFYSAQAITSAWTGDVSGAEPYRSYTFANGAPISATGDYTYANRLPGTFAGVAITYRYGGLTPLYNRGVTLVDTENTQIEPLAAGSYGGGSSLPSPIAPPTNPPAPTATSLPTSYCDTTPPNEQVWIDDQGSVPGGQVATGGDSWKWVFSKPTPFSGTQAHQSNNAGGEHQHYFYNAPGWQVGTGDSLFTYVYLDSGTMPSEIMLQWQDSSGSFDHRAYWGVNTLGGGTDGTASRRYMGALPTAGQWVRLEVPASQVGLEGAKVTGMAFSLYGGQATWDRAGQVVASGQATATAAAGVSGGPEGCWHFDEGSGATANDSSGNGNNGTLDSGATYTTTAKIGPGAVYLNGSNHAGIAFGATAGNVGASDFSAQFWVNTQVPSSQAILNKRSSCGDGNFWDLRTNTDGSELVFEEDQDGVGTNRYSLQTSNANINNGSWRQVTLVRQTTAIAIYVDGVLKASGTAPAVADVLNDTPLVLGTDAIGTGSCAAAGSAVSPFLGQIDELRLYGRALSSGNVLDTYNAVYAPATATAAAAATATAVDGGASCPCTIFGATTPGASNGGNSGIGSYGNPARPLSLGVKFYSDTAGYVTGVRFYRGATNPPTGSIAHLWGVYGGGGASGTRLADTSSITADLNAPGWYVATFATPIAVSAKTVYLASYYAPDGLFPYAWYNLASAIDNAPLHALADGGVNGPDGQSYGSNGVFCDNCDTDPSNPTYPMSTYQSPNYFVDVVFAPTTSGVTPAPTATSTSTATRVSTATPTPTSTAAASTPTATATPTNTATAASTPTATATPCAVPSPWADGDIGAVGVAGSACAAGGTYTVGGSGSDIQGTADAFHSVYQPLSSGSWQIVARVASLQNTDPGAKAGVMIRATLDPGAANAYMAISANEGSIFQSRASSGAATSNATQDFAPAAPYWVKLVHAGNVFTGYSSPDGVTWTQEGMATIGLTSTAYLVGLAVTSHNNTVVNTATFDNVTVMPVLSVDRTATAVAATANANATATSVAGTASTNSTATAVAATNTANANNTATANANNTATANANNTATVVAATANANSTATAIANATRTAAAMPTSTPVPPTATATPTNTATATPTNTATATPTNTATPTPSAIRINSGGGGVGSFVADTGYSGGSTASIGSAVDTSHVTNPGPQAVYQSERYGNFTYTVSGLTPGASYIVRLHFAETYWGTQTQGGIGSRVFNVAITDGQGARQVLTNYDIYKDAGGANIATIKEYAAAADNTGKITISYTTVTDNAKSSGIEIVPGTLPPTATPTNTSSPTSTATNTPTSTATATATPIPPTSTATATPAAPTTGLVGYWRFDEGAGSTTTTGPGGANNNGTLTGGMIWNSAGRFGAAVTFDGSSGYIPAANVTSLPAANAAQSISWWLKVVTNPSTSAVQDILGLSNQGSSSAVQPGFRNGQIGVWQYGGTFMVSAPPPTAGAWHHYVYTYDGSPGTQGTHRLYTDGVLVASNSTIAPQTATPILLEFGRWAGNLEYLAGSLDDVRIYNRALTAAEVQTLLTQP